MYMSVFDIEISHATLATLSEQAQHKKKIYSLFTLTCTDTPAVNNKGENIAGRRHKHVEKKVIQKKTNHFVHENESQMS